MTNRSKGKGTAAESAVVRYFQEGWLAPSPSDAPCPAQPDAARFRRLGTVSRFRAATQAERHLLAASGLAVEPGEAVLTHVTFDADGTRTRTWSRRPLRDATPPGRVPPPGGTPLLGRGRGTVREGKSWRFGSRGIDRYGAPSGWPAVASP